MEPRDKWGGVTRAMHRKLRKYNVKDVELFQEWVGSRFWQ